MRLIVCCGTVHVSISLLGFGIHEFTSIFLSRLSINKRTRGKEGTGFIYFKKKKKVTKISV